MLILSRKMGESIIVSGPAEISIQQIGDDRVRVGLVAEPAVKIMRSELISPHERQEMLAANELVVDTDDGFRL